MNQNAAILIFANSGLQESKTKSFRRSRILFDELNRNTLCKVKQTGLPFFHFSEEEQMGETFGERYTNAIQAVYDKGYDTIITIGNDTPHLTSKQLIKTADELRENPIVLGPSIDGGYYLMGLHKSQFNKEMFLKLPWQTSRLTQSIARLVAFNKIEVVLLKTLQDIDTVIDVQKLVDGFKALPSKTLRLLQSVVVSVQQIFSEDAIIQTGSYEKLFYNKGSPALLH